MAKEVLIHIKSKYYNATQKAPPNHPNCTLNYSLLASRKDAYSLPPKKCIAGEYLRYMRSWDLLMHVLVLS